MITALSVLAGVALGFAAMGLVVAAAELWRRGGKK